MATLMTTIDDTKKQLRVAQLAALKAADDVLARAHANVHARVEALEAAMRKAKRSRKAKAAKAKPTLRSVAQAA